MSRPQIGVEADHFILCYVLFWIAVMSPLLNHRNEKPLSHKSLVGIGLGGFEPPTS